MRLTRNKQKLSNGVKITAFFILFLAISGTVILSYGRLTKAAVHNLAISTTVQASLLLDVTAGDTVAFGSLTAGVPIAAPDTGTIASVTTNASNGYTLGVHDGVAASNSALLHTDTTTHITDVTSGDITTPALWGTSTGLGITLYAADTNKEAKWGTGTTYNDANNKYAAVPQAATTAHTVTGEVSGANTSSWAFKIDVPGDQKTGFYSGSVTFTATAVLS